MNAMKKWVQEVQPLAAKRSCIPVEQWKDGKLISRFSSIKEASKVTGVYRTSTSDCIHLRRDQAGGFVWRKGSTTKR